MHHHDDLGSKCAYTCHLSNKTTRKSVLLSTPQIWLMKVSKKTGLSLGIEADITGQGTNLSPISIGREIRADIVVPPGDNFHSYYRTTVIKECCALGLIDCAPGLKYLDIPEKRTYPTRTEKYLIIIFLIYNFENNKTTSDEISCR